MTENYSRKSGVQRPLKNREKIKTVRDREMVISKTYLNLSDELFRGPFLSESIEHDTDTHIKIKDGFRYGNTLYKSRNSGKVIKKETCKEGVLQ